MSTPHLHNNNDPFQKNSRPTPLTVPFSQPSTMSNPHHTVVLTENSPAVDYPVSDAPVRLWHTLVFRSPKGRSLRRPHPHLMAVSAPHKSIVSFDSSNVELFSPRGNRTHLNTRQPGDWPTYDLAREKTDSSAVIPMATMSCCDAKIYMLSGLTERPGWQLPSETGAGAPCQCATRQQPLRPRSPGPKASPCAHKTEQKLQTDQLGSANLQGKVAILIGPSRSSRQLN